MQKIWGGFAVLLVSASVAWAAPELGSRDEPIEITADSLEILQENQRAMFRGNVEAKQGDVTLKAATMTVHYRQSSGGDGAASAAGAVSCIEADGGVLLATKEETARSKRGVYNVDEHKVQMSGDVTLTRGQNILKGAQLVYDFKTGRSVLGSGVAANAGGDGVKPAAGGGRIRALFVPEKKN